MASILPEKAKAFAGKVGPELLVRTSDARKAVGEYHAQFGSDDWRSLRFHLESRATRKEIAEAGRIARIPPTVQVFNGEEFYTTIILGMMLHSEEVEGRQIMPFGVKTWPENPTSTD